MYSRDFAREQAKPLRRMTEMRRTRIATIACLLPLLAACCCILCGCRGNDPAASLQPAQPHAGVNLRLAVVSDPALAAVAREFQGEWKARTGAEYEVLEWLPEQLRGADKIPADVVICDSATVAALASQKKLLAVPPERLAAADLAWDDVLDALRLREAKWDGKTYGLTLGSPAPICYFRADLLAKFEKQPPETWEEYARLAAFFSDAGVVQKLELPAGKPWSGGIEPLADSWAGLSLLARAASSAKHPDFYSALFDIEDFRPLINTPPFVTALDELVAAGNAMHEQHRRLNIEQTREAFWRSECALAVAWPSVAGWDAKASHAADGMTAGLAELPGSRRVFNPGNGQWEERNGEVRRVPLISAAGRAGAVVAGTVHEAAAWQLAADLCGPQWGEQLGLASASTTMSRRNQLTNSTPWLEPPAKTAAKQYVRALEATLSRQEVLAALPIPGRDRYLAALDSAVRRAVNHEVAPQAALDECATQWGQITQELGPAVQGAAYRGSVVR